MVVLPACDPGAPAEARGLCLMLIAIQPKGRRHSSSSSSVQCQPTSMQSEGSTRGLPTASQQLPASFPAASTHTLPSFHTAPLNFTYTNAMGCAACQFAAASHRFLTPMPGGAQPPLAAVSKNQHRLPHRPRSPSSPSASRPLLPSLPPASLYLAPASLTPMP